MIDSWIYLAGVVVVASPVFLLMVLGVTSLLHVPVSERVSARLTQISVVAGLTASIVILAIMLATGRRHVPIELGNWVVIPEQHFHFHLKFVFDRLSVPFAILSFILCGTIGAFTSRYLHREPGYNRFFVLYSFFLVGMICSTLAGTIETLFFGWEFVGLSSALLVAFFHERLNPVRNGQSLWSIYRVSDAAFLIAAISLHHLTGAGEFDALMGSGPWPEGQATISSSHAFLIGSLLLFAAAGKSALIPFSGWLPRAMEGPTPSSAIFYGALSVHLGAFLLLRVSPLLDASLPLRIAVVAIGLLTAAFAAVTTRVQTDIKSALAFASLTQVGIIVMEIGFGLRYLALVHIIGHACLRTLQLLRAPTLLHDYNSIENAIGGHLTPHASGSTSWWPALVRKFTYRIAMERGFLDSMLNDYVVYPFQVVFRWSDRMERRWVDWLSGVERDENALSSSDAHGPEMDPGFSDSLESGVPTQETRADDCLEEFV